jgi:hypothetical protein
MMVLFCFLPLRAMKVMIIRLVARAPPMASAYIVVLLSGLLQGTELTECAVP